MVMRTLALALLAMSICAISFGAELKEYVYSRGDGSRSLRLSGHFSIRDLDKLPEGRYFWFRHNGLSLVIHDAATLQSIDRLFAESERMDPEFKALRSRMRPVESRERDLERRIDRIDEEIDSLEDDDEISPRDEQERRDLRSKRAAIRSELREIAAELRVLEREEAELDRRRDALEAQAEKKLVPLVEDAIRRGVAVAVR
jgi:hypothetical protein